MNTKLLIINNRAVSYIQQRPIRLLNVFDVSNFRFDSVLCQIAR